LRKQGSISDTEGRSPQGRYHSTRSDYPPASSITQLTLSARGGMDSASYERFLVDLRHGLESDPRVPGPILLRSTADPSYSPIRGSRRVRSGLCGSRIRWATSLATRSSHSDLSVASSHTKPRRNRFHSAILRTGGICGARCC
jgi:hypothetical protein